MPAPELPGPASSRGVKAVDQRLRDLELRKAERCLLLVGEGGHPPAGVAAAEAAADRLPTR